MKNTKSIGSILSARMGLVALVVGIVILSGCVSSPSTNPPASQVTPAPVVSSPSPVVTDTTPPSVSVNASPDKVYVGDKLTLTATASDDKQLREIRISYTTNEQTKTVTCTQSPCYAVIDSVPLGGVDYFAVATDASNNESRFPADATSAHVLLESGIKYNDTVPPKVTVTQDPGSPHVGNTITLTAFVSDISGVDAVEIFMDGASIKSCAFATNKVANCIVTASFAASGSHSYYATAKDHYGNNGQSAPVTLNIQP